VRGFFNAPHLQTNPVAVDLRGNNDGKSVPTNYKDRTATGKDDDLFLRKAVSNHGCELASKFASCQSNPGLNVPMTH